MKVVVREGGSITFRDVEYHAGDKLTAPDDVAQRWIDQGLASATVRAKPVPPPSRP